MSKGTINKVILIGNLGADPDFRQAPGGAVVANLNIATTNTWKDQTGQFQDHTEWHRVAVFGRTAEVARDYLRKGSKVYIEGSLRTRKWQDKTTGQDRYSTEIFVNEMQMLDRMGGGGQGGYSDYGNSGGSRDRSSGGYAPPPPPPGPARQAPEPNYPPSSAPGGGMDDFDDDIPF
ncbi:single-stranded DNA-binding protein [Methylomagnum sp.]